MTLCEHVPESVTRKMREKEEEKQQKTRKTRVVSALQRQLKQIEQQNRQMGGPTAVSGKLRHASILFDEKDAASLDLADIRELGLKALRELQQIDNVFVVLEPELFPDDRFLVEHFDRSLLTAEQNQAVDNMLYRAMMALTPHLQGVAGSQLLEWLIRGYRISEMSTEAWLAGLLPWHDSPLFVRCMQATFFVTDDKWGFLFEPCKQRAQSVSREFIARRCLVDSSILQSTIVGALRYLSDHSIGYTAKPHGDTDKTNASSVEPSSSHPGTDGPSVSSNVQLYASFAGALVVQMVESLDKEGDRNAFVLISNACSALARLSHPDAQLAGYLGFTALLAKYFSVLENGVQMIEAFVREAKAHAHPLNFSRLDCMAKLFI